MRNNEPFPTEKLTAFLATHREVHACPLAGYEEQLAHTKLAAADGMGPY